MGNPPASPAMRLLCEQIAGPKPSLLACPRGHRTIGVQLGVNGENAGRWYTSCVDRDCGFFKCFSDPPSVEMQHAINIQRQADNLSRDILKDAKKYRKNIQKGKLPHSRTQNGSSSRRLVTSLAAPTSSGPLTSSPLWQSSSRMRSSTLPGTPSSVAPSSPLAAKSKAQNGQFSNLLKPGLKRKRSSSSLPNADEVIYGARVGKRPRRGPSNSDPIVISDDDDIIIID